MTAAAPSGEGVVVDSPRYRLELDGRGLRATLTSPAGDRWAVLRPLAALDRPDGVDETVSVASPRISRDGAATTITVERRSTVWDRAGVTLHCGEEAIEVRAWVAGSGRLADVHLLGGRSLIPGAPTGFLPSGSSFRTLFSPNPGDPARLVRAAGETAVVGVSGDEEPGRGHWFFTPAPLYLALTTAEGVSEPDDDVAGGWLGVAIAAPVGDLTFVQLTYQPADRAFSLRLDYEGHTRVDGEFTAPAVVLTPGMPDPYTGLRAHRADLVRRGAAPEPRPRAAPRWWSAPIFCGWGAQCHLAATTGRRAAELATQENYDRFLEHLEGHDVVPGTVVVDDKWQEAYGTCVPDPSKWPDLKGWIAGRHARGQHVLLWWKAWDAEGLPDDLCVRGPGGRPVVVDPSNPVAREALAEAVTRVLAPEGLDADGLKIDFTARTPSGRALSYRGPAWGVALLHELLAVVYAAAKAAKPDALVITHTPHPGFVDVTDMIRLNDMLRLKDPGPVPAVVPQMRYRANVVRAACPELLVETDDWCVPDRETWRAYQTIKHELGVPSLYYATHFDRTGEELALEDYEALRRLAELAGGAPAPAASGARRRG
ncbi:MAG: hypothetical protein ICV64_06365 [Thermoleophilia bacterium]|nr:hypothetical protein [Thermoleophilia bacterium]